ncbi:hypothetical protein [Hyalangium minutum]|uniref:Uncharacterized protein n=1 Tax=Hyalangium minutum TaxID=394096 RepID=A0A085WMF7_9BACT|nr:hypothetical protein [Hyalangium minutum]KFE68870.1 hypothetical protein DB31_6772 [Hyalangium minutum]
MDWVQMGCWAGFGLLVAVQLVHTLRNTNRWPFVAQNMFSHAVPAVTPRLMVVLHDSLGGSRVVFPYSVLPVEFFRAQRLLFQVFVEGDDAERQERFAVTMLDRLNEAPWAALDEVESSIRPPPGARFVGFELVSYEYAIEEYVAGAELASIQRPLETLCSVHLASPETEPPPEAAVGNAS